MDNLNDVFDVINQSKHVGMFQFCAGVAGQSYPKKYYVDTFLPTTSIFLKPFSLGNQAKKFDYDLLKNTYIDYDMFIDSQEVLRFDFAPEYKSNDKIDQGGVVLLDDPFKTKNAIYQNPNYKYVKPNNYNDTASYVLLAIGACPKRNPLLRRIVGFEIAKSLFKNGYKVSTLKDGKLILNFPKTVSGLIGDWIKKANKFIRKVGKKVEDNITSPVRNFLKQKLPFVWKPINWIDKRLGLTSNLIKFNKGVIEIANKYGEQIALIAGNILINAVAPAYGSVIMTAVNMANAQLGKKQQQAIQNVVKEGAKASPVDQQIYKETFADKLIAIRQKMIKAKGKEGEKDFEAFLKQIQEANKEKAQIKEEVQAKLKEENKDKLEKQKKANVMAEDVRKLLSGSNNCITVYPFYSKFMNNFGRLYFI